MNTDELRKPALLRGFDAIAEKLAAIDRDAPGEVLYDEMMNIVGITHTALKESDRAVEAAASQPSD